jgi:hypothetical protein
VLEPDVLLPLVPGVPGLPDVPVSPVPEVPPVLEPVAPVPPMLPEVEPEVDDGGVEAVLLPGAVVSLLVVLDGVVLDVVEGVEDEEPDDAPVAVLPGCDLSQPATAAPAKARTATTGMSFFMTSPISV